jgi:hypothetical protein
MSSLVQWASSHAEGLLGPLGNRWAHVQAVADQAARIAPAVLPAGEREILVAAAWLHDIGYASALATTGLHPLDGARHLEALGVDRRLCCLVAHHSGATFEAEERGYAGELAAFEREDGPLMDALIYADMTTGPAGQRLTFEARIAEILARTRPAIRFIARSAAHAPGWPPRSSGPRASSPASARACPDATTAVSPGA